MDRGHALLPLVAPHMFLRLSGSASLCQGSSHRRYLLPSPFPPPTDVLEGITELFSAGDLKDCAGPIGVVIGTGRIGAGEGNRTPDLRFTNPLDPTDSKANQQVSPADCERVRQNPQPPRNQDSPHSDSDEKKEPKGGDE